MPNRFRTLKLDKTSIASGGSVVCTLTYDHEKVPGGPNGDVLVSCSPSYTITYTPKPLKAATTTNGTLKVTVTIARKVKVMQPPQMCRLIFNGLADEREDSLTVTP